jgi:hypothetical protein
VPLPIIFKARGSKNALYLDALVSRTYLPKKTGGKQMVILVMIGVTE